MEEKGKDPFPDRIQVCAGCVDAGTGDETQWPDSNGRFYDCGHDATLKRIYERVGYNRVEDGR